MNKLFTTITAICVVGGAHAQNTVEKQDHGALKKDLKEVTIEADNIVTTPDKIMVPVDKSVKKHSYDGYSALSLLHVPGLDVDPTDGKISALTGEVYICINGVEATHNDVKTLNPNDLIRLDYYTNFDPRHPDKRNVIDFIMKIRDYGGMVMLQPTQSLNLVTGSNMADWKMYHKKAELGVNVNYNYHHFTQNTGNWSLREMEFGRGDLSRLSRSLPTKNHLNSHNITLTYLQRFKNSTLKIAAMCNPSHSAGNGAKEEIYEGLLNRETKSADSNHRDELTPSFKVQYDQKLTKGGHFSAVMSGSYFNSSINRDYLGIKEDIFAYTKAHGATIRPSLQLSLPMGKVFTPYIKTDYLYTHTNSTYHQNGESSSNRYSYQRPSLTLGTNMNINRSLSATVNLSEEITIENYGYGSHTRHHFTPDAYFSYNNAKLGYFNIGGSIGTSINTPDVVMDVERFRDDFLITTGNPDLKSNTIYSLFGSYMCAKKWGWIQALAQYSHISKAIYQDYTCDDAREVFIQSLKNGGNYENFQFNLRAQYKIIPNRANITGSATYMHLKARTYRLHELHRIAGKVDFDYFNKGFVGQLSLRSPVSTLTPSGELKKRTSESKSHIGLQHQRMVVQLHDTQPIHEDLQRDHTPRATICQVEPVVQS